MMIVNKRLLVAKCCVVLLAGYFFVYMVTYTGTSGVIRTLQQSGRNLAAIDQTQALTEEVFDSVKKYLINNDPNRVAKIQQRGNYWVLYNYIKASKTFLPHESVTYATHGDFTFLDNLALLIERWRDPICLALYTPGYDFRSTIKSIRHRRDCTATLVKVFVTFRIFSDDNHFPDKSGVSNSIASKQDSNVPQKVPTEPVPTVAALRPTEPQRVNVVETTTVSRWDDALSKLAHGLKCIDKPKRTTRQQRGDYWVLYNYVLADEAFRCHNSIAYTTHADYSFLDNLVPLADRWNGPISLALHAPGSDFKPTLESIRYLRDCTTGQIKKFVTFHVYFSTKHIPSEVPKPEALLSEPFNCSLPAPYFNVSSDQMYKSQKKLLYPVNVGRNIARESAETHYVLASDIELYPSPNIIPSFLEMVANNKDLLSQDKPRVYTLHLFEVAASQQVPDNKTQLLDMLKNSTALPFHKKLCPLCHNVPKSKEWQTANETQGLHVFHVGKRTGKFVHWEPIFIGTHADPLYDERLSWEGKRDKMTQGYALCVLNYDFMILDNAFLVHRPGIKVYKKDSKRLLLSAKTNQLINKIIYPELKVIYGVRKGCAV